MTAEELINTIREHSLTVRCLPHTVVNHRSYKEGDENKKYVDSKGNPVDSEKEVVIQNHSLEYFENTHLPQRDKRTPQERYEQWKRKFPKGRKLLKETLKVQKGGWWYVKPTKNTGSTVRFSREYDKFFAPTLEEAIKLFLDSI